MNQSQKRREDLLYRTRSLYSDNRTIPAVHPRYGRVYSELYNDTEKAGSTLGFRIVICILLFLGYLSIQYNGKTILNKNSEQIKEVISEDVEIFYETEIFDDHFTYRRDSFFDSL